MHISHKFLLFPQIPRDKLLYNGFTFTIVRRLMKGAL